MIAGIAGAVVPSARSYGICFAMNERVKKLTEEIRKLSPDEQAELMEILHVLTYREPDPARDKAWAEEIDRRVDTVERGEAQLVDAREHLRRHKKP
jgi:Putative addiction module component